MTFKKYLFILSLLSAVLVRAQVTEIADGEKKNDLVGEWQLDLRPSPDSEAYFQVFMVETINDDVLIGSFYGSPVESGLVNRNWPELYLAFTTRDATYNYYHSASLKDGVLKGISYCPGRSLVTPWTGYKKME